MADFTEQQVFDALGLGEQEQEAAAPAPGGDTALETNEAERPPQETPGDGAGGEQEQEAAAPAPGGGDTDPESGEPGEQQEDDGEPAAEGAGKKRPMTEEQRKEAAAQRRRAETQAAIDKAVEEAVKAEKDRSKAEMDAFFAAAALKNTITGKPINNMEEFNAWKQAFEAAKLQKDLKAGRLTPEALQKVIEQTPAMQQVQQMVQRQDEQQRQQAQEAAQVRVDQEIAEIHKLDPSINTVKDLLTMPKAKEFYALVKKGNSFLDAFRLANFETLAAKRADAARQQAMNNARSKDHLTATGSQRGAGAAQVPPDEMAMFRLLNPGATDAEIQAYYNKQKNR